MIFLTFPLSLSVLFRVLAADADGVIHIWDRRTSTLPYLELTTNSRASLNSIQLNAEDQVIMHNLYNFWELKMLLWQKPAVVLVFFAVMNVDFNNNFSWLIIFSLILTLFTYKMDHK